MERINPLKPTPKQETARQAIKAYDQCPAEGCSNTMRILECNGHPAYVCLTHRVALPVPLV